MRGCCDFFEKQQEQRFVPHDTRLNQTRGESCRWDYVVSGCQIKVFSCASHARAASLNHSTGWKQLRNAVLKLSDVTSSCKHATCSTREEPALHGGQCLYGCDLEGFRHPVKFELQHGMDSIATQGVWASKPSARVTGETSANCHVMSKDVRSSSRVGRMSLSWSANQGREDASEIPRHRFVGASTHWT